MSMLAGLDAQAAAVRRFRPDAEPQAFHECSFERLVSEDTRRMATLVAALTPRLFEASGDGSLSLSGFCPNLPELRLLMAALTGLGAQGPRRLDYVWGFGREREVQTACSAWGWLCPFAKVASSPICQPCHKPCPK